MRDTVGLITAVHAIITDACRQNRGDRGATEEALRRVQEELTLLYQIHPQGRSVCFHVKLEVEQ